MGSETHLTGKIPVEIIESEQKFTVSLFFFSFVVDSTL